jgi:folate-binding protein YgfZ
VSAPSIELDGQYRVLREEAGFARREGRAVLRVTGTDAAEYLHSQLTNEIEELEPGQGCYAALLDRKGHMRGDMRVLRLAPDELLVELEPLALDAVAGHLRMYSIGHDVEIADASSELVLISVVGPAAFQLTGLPPLAREHDHAEAAIAGAQCRAIRTDQGVDLLCEPGAADELATALGAAGVEPVGEEALEIIRVESGRPRFGRDMGTQTIPQEAGINERAVSFTKGCYIGQETVARLHYKGKPNRHLRGLVLDEIVAAGEPVRLGERELGTIGTAVLSPARGPIALAILRREAEPGTRVEVGDGTGAEVLELPFGD